MIFLDIDGVLNAHNYCRQARSSRIEHAFVQQLNKILHATGAKIVLSSAWRYLAINGCMTVAGLDWLLRSHGMLSGHLIGITRADTMSREAYAGDPDTWPMLNERGQQIADFLHWWRRDGGEPIERFVAIDDLDLGITTEGIPFVQTHGKTGLTDADVESVIKLLSMAEVTR